MRAVLVSLVVAAALGVLVAESTLAVERFEDFAKARKALQQQLRSKQPADRVEALRRLGEFPLAESVTLIQHSLDDSTVVVRDAAYDTLLKLSDKQDVCDTLLLMAKKAVHRKDDGVSAAPLLAVLLTSDLAGVRRNVNDLLLRTAETPKPGVQVVLTLADQLGENGSQRNVLPLARLAESKVFDNHFGVRRAVVHSLTKIKEPDAIGALTEIVAKIRGEAQMDAVEHLTQVTGQTFGVDGAAWKDWWDSAKETFEFPKRSVESPYRSVAMKLSTESYYGLPVFAEKMVFVLDTSGSMMGAKIEAAKRELVRAISGLPDYASFGVIVFNGTVDVWQRQLAPATSKSRHAAIAYVNSQTPHSNTASYDALEAAFGFDTEAIYFLSDGAPHGGKISAPVDIVAAVTAANKQRRISIYTIGIDVGFPGGPLEMFLKTLAEQNLGLFARVDR